MEARLQPAGRVGVGTLHRRHHSPASPGTAVTLSALLCESRLLTG